MTAARVDHPPVRMALIGVKRCGCITAAMIEELERVRSDLAGQPRGVVEQAVRDLVAVAPAIRYGAASWKLTAARPAWLAELVTLGASVDSNGWEWMRVAIVLSCRRDCWYATTVLTKVARGRVARTFAPAWQAVAAPTSILQ